jgi:hypothetical protein
MSSSKKIDLKRNFAAGVYLSKAQNPMPPPYTLILTYLFTCEVIPHGPGRASQGTSAPGCASLASWLDRAPLSH